MSHKTFPSVGLGCMGMSEFYGDTNDAESLSTLEMSYDIGYRHYDTADMYGYGHNESLLGKFIKNLGNKRENIHLASKVGIQRDPNDKYNLIINNTKNYILKSCDETLKRLNVDYLDLYYLHRKDPNVHLDESIGALSELVTAGKIKSIGLCEVCAETLLEANDIYTISALQSEFSLWSRDIESIILPLCNKLDVKVFAFSPMGRGFLTGKISKKYIMNALSDKDFRTKMPRFTGANYDKNILLIEQMNEISESLGIKTSQLALSWLLAKSNNIVVIPGTKREKYLLENYLSININLDADIITKLDNIFSKDTVSGDRYPTKILNKSIG